MAKINPYFEANGQVYEIKRTRSLEIAYDRLMKNTNLSSEDEKNYIDKAKLETEFAEITERYQKAKEEYFEDVINADKKEKYKAFKELYNEKYDELSEFLTKNPNIENSINNIQEKAYENGRTLLIQGLTEQYADKGMTEEKAKKLWEDFTENMGEKIAKEWILFMAQSLFEEDEENTDPFLKQAKAKQMQKLQSRNGLSQIGK